MNLCAVVALTAILAGCGSGSSTSVAVSDSKNDVAARACDAYAKSQLPDKTYQLDLVALAASMKADSDMQALSAPIVIDPGSNGEAKETLDCKVRLSADGKSADVIGINFIF